MTLRYLPVRRMVSANLWRKVGMRSTLPDLGPDPLGDVEKETPSPSVPKLLIKFAGPNNPSPPPSRDSSGSRASSRSSSKSSPRTSSDLGCPQKEVKVQRGGGSIWFP